MDVSQQLTDTLEVLLVARKKETLQNGWNELSLCLFTTEAGTRLGGDPRRNRTPS
jgi:hypothetical protein